MNSLKRSTAYSAVLMLAALYTGLPWGPGLAVAQEYPV